MLLVVIRAGRGRALPLLLLALAAGLFARIEESPLLGDVDVDLDADETAETDETVETAESAS